MGLKELGSTGVLLPEIGLGTWSYHAGPEVLRRGLEEGALFIDTAESYGTESVVGEAVRGLRDQVFIATKVSPQHFRYRDVVKSVDASLHNLGIDHIDLYQLHEPSDEIAIEETMAAMAELVDAGKVRFIGVSNFSIQRLETAQKALPKYPIVSNQVRYSVIDRTIEAGLLHYCQTHRITVIAYSPLGREFSRIRDCDPCGVIDKIATMTAKTSAQVALNWILSKSGIVAIPKSNSPNRILENCGASGWRLSPEQLASLDSGIRYRRRNRFDQLVRQWLPGPLQSLAVQTLNAMPRGLRRRFQ